jgi:hypothetical protein
MMITDSRQTTYFLRGLHAGQQQVFRAAARFKLLVAGRRWGKTRLGVAAALCRAVRGGRVWWVAPNYPMTAAAWRELRCFARRVPGTLVREADLSLRMRGGGWLRVKSADRPDSLRGEGLDLAVLDEAAYIPEAAWTEALRPALSDRLGDALFISTPAGRNWFWRLCQGAVGQDWACWRFPTSANPYILPSEIEAARLKSPERVFRQEYLAEFVPDGSGVFRRVREAAMTARQEQAVPGHEYVIGADWGKQNDFSCFVVIDTALRAVVELDRSNQVDYAVQRGRLKALCERFQAFVVIGEANAMGDPICEDLARDGVPIQPFQTTQASKILAVEALAVAFERGDLKIIPDETLIAELQAFESERLPSGLTRYSAPAGAHDDCVMALAMAYHGLGAAPSGGVGISF